MYILIGLKFGIRSINGCLTCGRGQRLGILAGSGVGKSVLLGMMAQNTDADVNVIALIGERGREVKEFIERDLQEEGMKRSVMVVATSDQPPLLRMRGAFVATAIAEYFCSKGLSVLLMMDSITRFAMAQREVGLAAGEPPTTKGYPPSVFAMLPKLLERAGTTDSEGSITGFYTSWWKEMTLMIQLPMRFVRLWMAILCSTEIWPPKVIIPQSILRNPPVG